MIKENEEYETNNSGVLRIVAYTNSKNIIIEFIQSKHRLKTNASNIYKGEVKDPFSRNVEGVGFLGSGKYSKKLNPKAYTVWNSMLQRCYSDKTTKPYINCLVEDKWHNFQNFGIWFDKEYIAGYDLDKDLLVANNKRYGPYKCLFVPRWINLQFKIIKNMDTAKGVFVNRIGKYYSQVQYRGKTTSTSCTTKEQANRDFIQLKIITLNKVLKEPDLPQRLINPIKNRIKELQNG